MEIPLGFFNLADAEHFRKINDIKKIPVIQLVVHKNVISYGGLLDEKELLAWVKDTTRLDKIPELEGKEHLEKISSSENRIFIFTGETNHPRFSLFAEGYY